MEFSKDVTNKMIKEYMCMSMDMVFNQIPVPIVFVDSKCKIVSLNNGFLDYLGMKNEEVKGKCVSDIDPNARLPIVLKTGKAEIGHRHKLEGRKDVIADRIPIFHNKRIIGGVSIIIIDDLNYLYNLINENHLMRNLNINKTVNIPKLYSSKYTFDDILTNSPNMQKCKNQASIFADTDFTVLITGESGVGKELFAHAIHHKSRRKDKPFIRVNCAAIPENLMEAELFGYEEGAFTGASKKGKIGKFQLANTGTIFLDEIGELPVNMQTKLLRVLQEKEIEPIGSNKILNIDVRVIAATNCHLLEKVNKGEFRLDLYYRINVLNLEIPPLRERKSDIPILIKCITDKFYKSYGILKRFPENVVNILCLYDWPGNIRELNNVIERMTVLSKNEVIGMDSIPDYILGLNKDDKDCCNEIKTHSGNLKKSVLEVENKIIIETLIRNNFNKSKTSKELGIPRVTLYRKLREIYSCQNDHS